MGHRRDSRRSSFRSSPLLHERRTQSECIRRQRERPPPAWNSRFARGSKEMMRAEPESKTVTSDIPRQAESRIARLAQVALLSAMFALLAGLLWKDFAS